MWCYQKPGFEALLLAELQKQQQSNQFCDTFLKADGISVPAHSCILSAISPHFSSSFSSLPTAVAGQKRLMEFGALGACTLLHLVRLLYSGKMVGEGEEEKQEAISAAAKLGIHGLVEVLNIDSQLRKPQDECLYVEVGVQTESQMVEEHQARLRGWRREVRDGATLLWRERLPTQGTEMWTQTDDLQVNCASLSQTSVSYETIDLNALQTLGHSDSLQIPYVPMSVDYPSEDNYSSVKSFVSAATPSSVVHSPSVQTNVFPISSHVASHTKETTNRGPEVNRAIEEWPEQGFEQFEGNIPGFINYFLNPENEEQSNRRSRRRRTGSGVGESKQVGTRPRGRPRGRRGGLMQTVDVQNVGVSKLSKLFLQRGGMYVNRTGQGGGTVGRKLYVKSREIVKSGRCTQSRKGRGIEWNIDQCASILVKTEAGTSTQRGRQRRGGHAQQHQLSAIQRGQKATKAPQAQGPEEQPEQIDLLLEEVMMGLDILPNTNKKSQVSSSTSRHNTATACPVRNQRGQTSMVTVATKDGGQSSPKVPVLQQPQEGELTDILDQFLQSFERLESAASQSSTQSTQLHTSVTEYRKTSTQVPVHSSQQHSAHTTVAPAQPETSPQSETSGSDSPMTSVHSVHSKKHLEKANQAVRRLRKKKDYLFSLEKPRTKSKKTTEREALKKEVMKQRASRQLQQIPMVRLEWKGALPENVRVQEISQSLVPRAKRSSSNTSQWSTKTYPIRSRFKEAQIDIDSFLEKPCSDQAHRGRHPNKVPLPFLSQSGSFPVEEHGENNNDQVGPDTSEPKTRGMKRSLDSDMRNSEVKRVCLNPPESISQNPGVEEIIDIETVSMNSTSNTVLIINSETMDGEASVAEEVASDTEAESIIDVDSDFGEVTKEHMVHAEVICSLRAKVLSKTSDTEDFDDEVDVTGSSSPAPAPVLISWTDTSESDNDSDLEAPEEQMVILSRGQLVRC